MKFSNIILTTTTVFLFSCNSIQQKSKDSPVHSPKAKTDTLNADTVLRETFKQEDFADNEYLLEKLKPIRSNFKRINSIEKWSSKETKELNETTEGGEAIFYYSNVGLEKITTRHFGETFQKLTEYYLLDGQLSFVFEKLYKYNRPIYHDSASMKENKDNQTFDENKSEIEEDRSYFENRRLIHQISNQDCGSPFSEEYLTNEQKRIATDFGQLRSMIKSP